jgi:hypothetical protein
MGNISHTPVPRFFGGHSATIDGTIELRVTDKDGNVKPLWDENRIGRWFRTKLGIDLRIPMLGRWVPMLELHNITPRTGKAAMARLIGGISETAATYIALGSGTTAEADTQTQLVAEHSSTTTGLSSNATTRYAATMSNTTSASPAVTNDTVQFDKTYAVGGAGGTVAEVGVFNNATIGAGIMFGRKTFAGVILSSGDNFQATYKITVG